MFPAHTQLSILFKRRPADATTGYLKQMLSYGLRSTPGADADTLIADRLRESTEFTARNEIVNRHRRAPIDNNDPAQEEHLEQEHHEEMNPQGEPQQEDVPLGGDENNDGGGDGVNDNPNRNEANDADIEYTITQVSVELSNLYLQVRTTVKMQVTCVCVCVCGSPGD